MWSLKDPFLGLYCFPLLLPLGQVTHKYNISFQFHVDDPQIYLAINPSDLGSASLITCLSAISS